MTPITRSRPLPRRRRGRPAQQLGRRGNEIGRVLDDPVRRQVETAGMAGIPRAGAVGGRVLGGGGAAVEVDERGAGRARAEIEADGDGARHRRPVI